MVGNQIFHNPRRIFHILTHKLSLPGYSNPYNHGVCDKNRQDNAENLYHQKFSGKVYLFQSIQDIGTDRFSYFFHPYIL